MPLVRADRPMEPDGVVKTGKKETFQTGLVVWFVVDP